MLHTNLLLCLLAFSSLCEGKKTLLKRIDFTKGDDFIQKSVVVILTENTPLASFGDGAPAAGVGDGVKVVYLTYIGVYLSSVNAQK